MRGRVRHKVLSKEWRTTRLDEYLSKSHKAIKDMCEATEEIVSWLTRLEEVQEDDIGMVLTSEEFQRGVESEEGGQAAQFSTDGCRVRK